MGPERLEEVAVLFHELTHLVEVFPIILRFLQRVDTAAANGDWYMSHGGP